MIIVRIIRTNGNLHLEYNWSGMFCSSIHIRIKCNWSEIAPPALLSNKPLQELLLMIAELGLIQE